MQKTKQKGDSEDAPAAKKKKVQFTKLEKVTVQNGIDLKPAKKFDKTKKNKDGPKSGKKFDGSKGVKKFDSTKNGKKFDGPKGVKKFDSPKGVKKFDGSKGGKKFDGPKRGKKFDGPKGAKKFDKLANFKGKQEFSKGNKVSKDDNAGEKPKWSEMKKEKKQLRIVRRKAKASAEVFEIGHKAKLLSAQIQRKVVKSDVRLNSCKELHCLMKGQYKSIALTHDLSRVIQVLLKYGPEDIKNEITEELLDIMVPMVQSKYAHHSVKRILKYGTDFIRHEVIKKFYGHIVSLAAHSISAPVLDYAYGEFATKKEKIYMQQEFYGEMYKNNKDDKVKTLSDAYKDTPQLKTAILQACKANIQRILDKNLHDGELLHSVLYDYLRECGAEERTELVATLSPLIVPLSNSLPGADAAALCVWRGTNKDKKTILKVVKEHAVALSTHKSGYRLLVAIFDAVDDTVLVRKTVLAALLAGLKDVARDRWGRMTLHWLVKPRDPAAFHPSFVKFLAEGAAGGFSKKEPAVRERELRAAALPALAAHLREDPAFWLSCKANMLLAVAILSIESSPDIHDALARVICRPDWAAAEGKDTLAVEDAGIHMCLKKLAALDKGREGEDTLGNAVAEHLTDETVKAWVPTNRGCFFLLKLTENNSDKVASKIIKKIKPHSGLVKQQSSEGAKLLLHHLLKK